MVVDPVIMVAEKNVLQRWAKEREAHICAMERDCARLDAVARERRALWVREATRARNARAYDRFQWLKILIVSAALGILTSVT